MYHFPSIIKQLSFILFIGLILFSFPGCYVPDIPVAELTGKYTYDDSDFMELDGLNIHYRKTGDGPPLLLLHGTGASLHAWASWTAVLKEEWTVISMDLPGFGLTGPRPDGDYSMATTVLLLDQFVNTLGLDSFAIGGNSLGGAIAWNFAAKHPERVTKLILIDPAGYPINGKRSLVFRLSANKWIGNALKSFTPKALYRKSLKEVFYDDSLVTDEMVNRYFELSRREGNRKAFLDRARTMEPSDTALIAGITAPTLILWGLEDAWIPATHGEKFLRDMPDAKLVTYPHTGHLPMEEEPHLSAHDAASFLKGQ